MNECNNPNENKIKVFSFFSGAGFLDLGFEMAGGYEIVLVNEYSKIFNDVYRYARSKMHIQPPKYGYQVCDVNSLINKAFVSIVSEEKATGITGFIGGPPCPDFSIAGKNRGRDGEHGKLSLSYVNLICKCQPDFFLFENVKGLYRTKKHRAFFEELKEKLKANGYYLTCQLVNAIEFGVPQDRERIILIGVTKKLARRLHKKYRKGELLDFPWSSEKIKDVKIKTELSWPTETEYHSSEWTEPPTGIDPEITVQYWWNKNDVTTHPNANMYFKPHQALEKFKIIPEGCVKKLSFKRLHRWRYSPTAAYGNNEVHLHPYLPRRISVAEALAIQSLPREYEIPANCPLTAAFKTIGNGVPYLLSLALAKSLNKYLYATKIGELGTNPD